MNTRLCFGGKDMKRLKKEVSVLLAVALMLSCLTLDFGTIPASALENNIGTGVFRVDVQVAANNCANAGGGLTAVTVWICWIQVTTSWRQAHLVG
jgi:hypothetical protein